MIRWRIIKVVKTLDELFGEAKGSPVLYDDKYLVQAVEIPISEPCIFTARVLKNNPKLRQGITLQVKPGMVEDEGGLHKSVICWYDHEPWVLETKLLPNGHDAKLFVWNSWETNGRTDAWIGNSGIVVERPDPAADIWIARCSAGPEGVDLDDFVFTFELS